MSCQLSYTTLLFSYFSNLYILRSLFLINFLSLTPLAVLTLCSGGQNFQLARYHLTLRGQRRTFKACLINQIFSKKQKSRDSPMASNSNGDSKHGKENHDAELKNFLQQLRSDVLKYQDSVFYSNRYSGTLRPFTNRR